MTFTVWVRAGNEACSWSCAVRINFAYSNLACSTYPLCHTTTRAGRVRAAPRQGATVAVLGVGAHVGSVASVPAVPRGTRAGARWVVPAGTGRVGRIAI